MLSTSIAPQFTERMTFAEPERIVFTHEPPSGSRERAGAEGRYDLVEVADDPGSTHLTIDLQITVDLPLPRASGPAVRTVMKQVVARMGDRFADNLYDHLGLEKAEPTTPGGTRARRCLRLVHRHPGGPRAIEVRELPEPHLGPGSVLVEVRAAGVNPVDWKLVTGGLGAVMESVFPVVPGWDVAGVVVASGWTPRSSASATR